LGKKLLVGSDVPEDFLSREPARHCKALVGNDRLSCEKKNANGSIPLQGNFGCLISSNHSLRFPKNDDQVAWTRRLLTFEFPNAFQGKKEVDFADKLIAEEGDAIFSWAVRGRELLQKDLIEYGEVRINDTQKKRVQRIADQSCTVSNFVEERLVTENAITETTTTKEMHEEYSKFCLSDNLTMEPELVFSKELKSVFESTENVRASNSILDSSGKKVRGYRGVKIKGN
jgi:phage/plasmid-associated DNA primase